MDYAKLINDNTGDFEDPENLEDFLDNYMQDGDEVSAQEDSITEYADGLVPIYYNDIMEEWRNNGQCHGQAKDEGLTEGAEGDVYKLMQMDLYCMYYGDLSGDFQTLINLVEDQEEEEEEEEEIREITTA